MAGFEIVAFQLALMNKSIPFDGYEPWRKLRGVDCKFNVEDFPEKKNNEKLATRAKVVYGRLDDMDAEAVEELVDGTCDGEFERGTQIPHKMFYAEKYEDANGKWASPPNMIVDANGNKLFLLRIERV